VMACQAFPVFLVMPDRENQQPNVGMGLGPGAVLASGLVRGVAGSRRLR
jgi:hypothetical protein